MKKYIFLFLLVATISFTSEAQKFGFINAGNIVQEITSNEKTDDALLNYTKPMMAEGEAMAKKFEANTQAFYQEANQGLLSQVAVQQRQVALQEEEGALRKYEAEVQQKIALKRQELLTPILERIQVAIDAVAKEKGFSMIFDSGLMNAVLFTTDSDDIGPAVRAKLGI